jgi:riboflavin kinase/FMN adenylyltransferase
MQHYHALNEVSLQNTWLTIGTFDGVHLGHQTILKQLVAGAHAQQEPAVVLTFHPRPASVLQGLNGPFYLTSPDERAELMGRLGVDVVFTLPFTRETAVTSAEDFMRVIKEHLDLRVLLVGEDFALGRGREGNLTRLRELGQALGYDVRSLERVAAAQQPISSTRIRNLLLEGDVTTAGVLLDRPYRLQGEVVHGAGRGRTIGIPTANIAFWPEQILPANGVYACYAHWQDQCWAAATNIGLRPTFSGEKALSIEAHLLDFSADLYGQHVRLEFIQRLRGEQKFSSVEMLIEQIRQDVQDTRHIVNLKVEG